jgi:hypothetical protein
MHSEFLAGPVFHQVEPGDDGDCLFVLGAGAASTTTVRVDHSLLTGCVTDGLEVAGTVADGSGPINKLSFDVRNSQITGNTLSNVRVANSSPVSRLEGRIERTDLSRSPGTPVILENIDASGQTRERLDFGGGSLGSSGGNCIYGGLAGDVLDVGHNVSARDNWWGQPGGPGLGRAIAVAGALDSGNPLVRAPRATC